MEKNQGGKWVVFAFQDEGGSNPGEPVAGDAANITANVRIDGGAANAVDDANPTELEDGYYVFDITAAESNGDMLLICPVSGTANVNVIGVPGAIFTTPPNFNAIGIESDGHVHGDLKQWLGVAPLALSSQQVQGVVPDTQKVDVETIKTQAVTCGAGVTVHPAVGLSTTAQGNLEDMTDGTGAVLTLSQLRINSAAAGGAVDIDNSNGPGVAITASGGSGHGIYILTAGHGIYATASGSSSSGMYLDGGSAAAGFYTVGSFGIEARGTGGSVIELSAAGANTHGIYASAQGSGNAIQLNAAGTGEAINFLAGDLTGNMVGDITGTLSTGPTVIKAAAATGTLSTTQCTSTLTHADNRLVGRKIVFTAGTASGQAGLITAYANASGLVTWIPAMAIAPADGDTFEIHDFDSGLITRAATYQAGAIWIDTINGTAGTVDYVNGTSTNPTDSIADANTLATSVGIVRFNVAPASSITLAESQENQIFSGSAWFLVLNGQSVNLSTFEGAVVTGIGTGIGTWNNCSFGTCTLGGAAVFRDCVLGDAFFGGTITLGSAAVYTFLNCTSNLPGPVGVTIDFAAIGNSTVNLTGFEGSVTIANLGATGTDVLVVTGDCEVTLAASCTGGTVFLNGNIGFTNNGSGQTIYQDARFELSRILSDSTAFDGADIAAILLDTGTDGVVVAAGSKTGYSLAATGLDLVTAWTVDITGTISTVTTVTNAVTTDAASRTASKADVSALATSAALADGTVQVGTVQEGAIGADAVADIFSTTAIAEAYAADGSAGTIAQLLYMIQQRLAEFAITDDGDGTSTLTVKKLDGSTTAATISLNGDGDTAPTSSTRAS